MKVENVFKCAFIKYPLTPVFTTTYTLMNAEFEKLGTDSCVSGPSWF